jgi:hypothetical protein
MPRGADNVRIADTILRGGHVSDEVLAEAWYSGARPAHLDHCDACAERALDMARWLEQTKQLGIETADAVFTPERLAAQQSQILNRLEQLDRPSKLLSFPRATAPAVSEMPQRSQHIGAWIAVAAACLILGVIGGRLSVWQPSAPPTQIQSAKAIPAPEVVPPAEPFPSEIDQPQLNSLSAIETLTPQPQVVVARTAASSSAGRRR